MSRFVISETPLAGLKLITRKHIGDSRGFLSRLFCQEELVTAGWQKPIAQINHTYTARQGTIRGLHFQRPPHTEMKLVSCIRGEVWDVAVDLRANSPTFLDWHAEKLSVGNNHALLIPEGFAHGFQALSDDCELLYLHSAAHMQGAEAGVRYDDPRIGIAWPLQVAELSSRDQALTLITPGFSGIAHK